jgi:RNA polymerase sigma factor (sigma-70 family)
MATTEVRQSRTGLLAGRSPLLRFQSDERLIALIRAGNDGAFEHLFERYRSRLLAFCRHMLGSKEDAEDVLQEVFAASYNAIRADERELHVRPWLYRIARNRCLNHLRRPTQDPRETMDDQMLDHGVTTADLVHRRADFRHLLDDIQKLPETQRTALLLREMDALSYEQIAEAMDNTVPSVKSLLVRARMSLAEAAEARRLTCADVRLDLAEIAEGLKKLTPPIRRHVRECEQCHEYRAQLRKTSTAMAIALPLGPIAILKKLFALKLGTAAAAGSGGAAAAGGGTAAGGAVAGGAAAGGAAATGAVAGGAAATGAATGAAAAGGLATGGGLAAGGAAAGIGAVATKAVAVTAATALIAGGAVEVKKISAPPDTKPKAALIQQVAPPAPPQETGGQSAQTLPPVSEAKQELAKAKQEDAQGATGATGPADQTDAQSTTITGATGVTGVTGSSGSEGATGTSQPEPSGNGTQPSPGEAQTGGATLPPAGQPAPAPAPKHKPTAGAGSTGTTSATPAPQVQP